MGVCKPKKDPTNWWIDYRVDRKRYRRKIGPAKRKAEQALNTIKAQIAAGTYFEARRERLTFAELAARYLENPKNPEKRSLSTDRKKLKPLLAYFHNTDADTITPEHVKRYVKKRQGDISPKTKRPLRPATINRELSLLSVIYSTGKLHGLVQHNPCQGVPKLREDNIRNHEVSHDQFLKLVEALPDHWRPIIATCYYTGMRLGEVLKLTWDRVDLEAGWFYLRREDTKTHEARKVPIPEPLLPYMENLPEDQTGTFRVFTYRGRPIIRLNARYGWRRAIKAAGLPEDLHVHDLRHCYVTNAVRAGIAEDFIMAVTGHKTRSVFSRYVDPTPADLRASVQRMDTIWTPSSKGVSPAGA